MYRAVHVGLEKSFAIKLLKTDGPPSSAALERFRREAVVLGRLRHPNIVEVTDSGIDGSEGGHPYIVTELLEGRPLSDVCRDQGPLPLAQALPLLEQIAAAVDAAHNAGILHRDLKPSNVFVCSESLDSPSVKILDFGLAKLLAEPDKPSDGTLPFREKNLPGLTATGSLLGTPLYLAPEVVRLGKATRSSDIYSFGVLAYEILGGKPPFRGTLEEILAGHLNAMPPPLPLPPEVLRPLRAALQKYPTRRPGTAGEVVRQFRKGITERKNRRKRVEAIRTARAGQRTLEQAPESQNNFANVALFLSCAAIIGVLGFMSGLAAERRPPEPPPATTPRPPTVRFGFNEIQQACGDLSSLPNHLCLVNRGSERIAGGERLVIDEDVATFTSVTSVGDRIAIVVEGEETYRLQFGPPTGKALVPGLYTVSTRWPYSGPQPSIDGLLGSSACSSHEGQFRILQIQLTGDEKVRRFVADFETTCDGAIGRIALGPKGQRIEFR